MRILIISDIHANLTAFKAVLKHMQGQWDYVWCLGDVVGYGPDPNECIELLKTLPHLCLAGNHDWAALDLIDTDTFSTDSRQAILWTQEKLQPHNRTYLADLPLKFIIGEYTLVHGSPREPVWEYILEGQAAEENFNHYETQTCFVGHTHTPTIFQWNNMSSQVDIHAPSYNAPYLTTNHRQIINVGSVGQPRDQNPNAACGVLNLDTNEFQYHRIPYDIADVQKRIRAAKLPERLAARLEHGW